MMTSFLTFVILAVAGFAVFAFFAIRFIQREYNRHRKLTRCGALVHISIFGMHALLSVSLTWGTQWIARPESGIAEVIIPHWGMREYTGLALMFAGLIVLVSAMNYFRDVPRWLGSGTPGLVTGGWYRYSRNPQFLGYGLVNLGFVVVWWSHFAMIGFLVYAVLVILIVRIEEAHLASVYGPMYTKYLSRVPRFLGLTQKDATMGIVHRGIAEYYQWGESCEGWHLLKTPRLSIIQERVPPGGTEVMHYHEHARQFFFVLAGEVTIETTDGRIVLKPMEGVTVPPGTPHRLYNAEIEDAHFLVISEPPSHGDRVTIEKSVS